VIGSFACAETRRLFIEGNCRKLPSSIHRVAVRKLFQIHFAAQISDLSVPPGNRLEKLSGDREGQWSIRVNDQWRLCFEWTDGDAEQVEVVDYH